MKRAVRLAIGLAILGCSTLAAADVVEVNLDVPSPEVWTDDAGYCHVEIPGYLNVAEPGAPALPGRSLLVLLPPGQEAAGVELLEIDPQVLPGEHVVAPRQRPVPLSWQGPVPVTEPDARFYGPQAQALPTFEAAEPQWLRGFSLLPVVVRPVRLDPQTGVLVWSSGLRLRVTTVPRRDGVVFPALYRGQPVDFERVSGLVANPEGLKAYPVLAPERNPDVRYLVITSQTLANCSGSNTLNTLVADKQARGLTTQITTMETIRSSTAGVDDAQKVRNYILSMVQGHGTEFVLLVGDADGAVVGGETQAPVVPVRNLYGDAGGSADDVPSDLYYACLDGTFDGNGNGVYGEQGDSVDLMAEVQLGRAAADSCPEVANFVRKTLAYQNGSGDWLRRAYFVGEWLWDGPSDNYGKDYMERIHYSSTADGINTKGFSENTFFQVGTLYDKDLGGPDSWGVTQILGVINGNQHLINHLGHSYTMYNMRLTCDDIDSGMTNTQYFFEYTQGCYPGAFDNRLDDSYQKQVYWQDSFAEHMTLGTAGAFAVVMNTRYGWGGGVSNAFHRFFWDGMFRSGLNRLGALQEYSKEQLTGWASDAYFRWVYYESTLFGDPEIVLHSSGSTTNPTIGLPAEAPWFLAVLGGEDPQPETIDISNLGGGVLNWNASSDQSWLTVSPGSGTAPSTLTLTADAHGLSAGQYDAVLTVSAAGATNSPQTMTISLYVISIPTEVAVYKATAPTVDGVINASEYTGSRVLDLDPGNPGTSSAWMVHDGSKLYFALDLAVDTDADDYDYVAFVVDVNNDGLWPTSAGTEGQFVVVADGEQMFSAFWNAGAGMQAEDWTTPAGIQHAFGFANNRRQAEVSFDLTASQLQRAMGESFGLFLLYLEYDAGISDWQLPAHWPYAATSWDDCRYLGDVTIGTTEDRVAALPTSMAFQAPAGGAPTSPMSLTVSSTTANSLAFTVASGASWLKLGQTSGSTPAVISVWADPAGQTAGNKTANLTITAAGASNSPLTVPVTFAVTTPAPIFGLNPNFLSFSAVQGAASPAAQSFQLSNLGGGTLSWTSQTDGAWFSLNPSSGTAPATVQVIPNTTAMPAGMHAGTITLHAAGAQDAQVGLSLNVTTQPHLTVSPSAITRTDPLAGGEVTVDLTIANSRNGTMDWSVVESATWLSVAPGSGTYISGHPARVVVTLNPQGLGGGLHETDLTVSGTGADNTPQTVHVAWTLDANAKALAVSPASLSFTGRVGGVDPAVQTLQVAEAGGSSLSYTVTCSPSWLHCQPASGSAPGNVSVSVATAGLSEGVLNGAVTVASSDATNSPVTVNVQLTMQSGGDNQPPPAPVLLSPANGATIDNPNPELTIQDVLDPDGDSVRYTFEVTQVGSAQPYTVIDNVMSGGSMTSARVEVTLDYDTPYEWRARATDVRGLAGDWSESWQFIVEEPSGGGGCGCATDGAAGSGQVWLGLALALLFRRRLRVNR